MSRLLIFNDANYEFKVRSNKYKSTGPLEKATMSISGSLALDGISSAQKVGVKILAIDGYSANKENIVSGNYPFFRPLYIAVNKTNQDPLVLGFVDFLLSHEGQEIISREGTVNFEEGKALNSLWKEKTVKMGNLWQDEI